MRVWPIVYTCILLRLLQRNQEIKTIDKKDQAIKQASGNESNNQALILVIKILDRRRSWKYIGTGHMVVTTPCMTLCMYIPIL